MVYPRLTICAAAGAEAPAGTAGEMAFYLEHLASELEGSKFAPDARALRSRLEAAAEAIDRKSGPGGGGPSEARALVEAAGYFRAAANSAMPVPAAEGAKVTLHPDTTPKPTPPGRPS